MSRASVEIVFSIVFSKIVLGDLRNCFKKQYSSSFENQKFVWQVLSMCSLVMFLFIIIIIFLLLLIVIPKS